ncbi:transmembrane protein 221 [Anguilla rostrata]|uniref:transmembrane protein 221 n=1 Tax=Anguilla rostrata TaxID=7938 RepID=UPI0030CC0724
MTNIYSQRSLTVLAFLGVLSAIMSLLSVVLIFQLQSHHTGTKDSSSRPSVVPAEVSAVLMPVATVLTALSLTLNLSSVVVCLLHSYFTTEICKGEDDTDRADWFLLDSRTVRHVAVGLFCLGISVYLAAMSMYMLLVFETETGIASACVLASGILVLLVAVAHSLARASRASRGRHSELPDAVYQNEHESCPSLRPSELGLADRPRKQRGRSSLQRQLSYPPCADPKQQQHSPPSDREGYSGGGSVPRMHRTLSAESGLLQAQAKPWNGINSEMRTVLARKSGGTGKDSTLV